MKCPFCIVWQVCIRWLLVEAVDGHLKIKLTFESFRKMIVTERLKEYLRLSQASICFAWIMMTSTSVSVTLTIQLQAKGYIIGRANLGTR